MLSRGHLFLDLLHLSLFCFLAPPSPARSHSMMWPRLDRWGSVNVRQPIKSTYQSRCGITNDPKRLLVVFFSSTSFLRPPLHVAASEEIKIHPSTFLHCLCYPTHISYRVRSQKLPVCACHCVIAPDSTKPVAPFTQSVNPKHFDGRGVSSNLGEVTRPGLFVTSCPTLESDLCRGCTKFDFTVDEGKGSLDLPPTVKKGRRGRSRVEYQNKIKKERF